MINTKLLYFEDFNLLASDARILEIIQENGKVNSLPMEWCSDSNQSRVVVPPPGEWRGMNWEKISKALIKDVVIEIEVAITLKAKAKGLSRRLSLGENEGMFFVFDSPSFHLFWMSGMKFGIDIIWINQDYRIVDISKNVQPRFFPQFLKPNKACVYVLEVNAGFSDLNKIEIGDLIKLA